MCAMTSAAQSVRMGWEVKSEYRMGHISEKVTEGKVITCIYVDVSTHSKKSACM